MLHGDHHLCAGTIPGSKKLATTSTVEPPSPASSESAPPAAWAQAADERYRLAEEFREVAAQSERFRQASVAAQEQARLIAEQRDKLLAAIEEIWGVVCPDCGPTDAPGIVAGVVELRKAHRDLVAARDRLAGENAGLHAETDYHLKSLEVATELALKEQAENAKLREFDRGWRAAEAEIAAAIGSHDYEALHAGKLWMEKLRAELATKDATIREMREALEPIARAWYQRFAGFKNNRPFEVICSADEVRIFERAAEILSKHPAPKEND